MPARCPTGRRINRPPRPGRCPDTRPTGTTRTPAAASTHPPTLPARAASPEPDGPKSPRWLWVVAGVAVVTVIGLVIALVIVNSSQQETMVAPLPSQPEPSFAPPTERTPTTTSRTPPRPVLPLPTPSTRPSPTPPTTTAPGATDTVVYNVSGSGRAINITYVDTGGLLQTEFNVMLPWSREVTLPQPGEDSASISIINVGREVNCSITVNGTQIEQRTGAGLTICAATR